MGSLVNSLVKHPLDLGLTDETLRRMLVADGIEVEMSEPEFEPVDLGPRLKRIRTMLGRSLREMERELAKDGVSIDYSTIRLLEKDATPNLEKTTQYLATLVRIWREAGEALGYKIKTSTLQR